MRPPSPRIFALFSQALDHDEATREAWLEQASGDPEERRQVAAMLAHSETTGPLDRPFFARPDAPGDPQEADDAVIGQQVGVWRVTGVIGRGGMGSVYRAERADGAFEQQAALKLVHPRLGHDFRARFLRERTLLAGLDHPGIARLIDGGLDVSGAPFLAMECVDGQPITAYAETHNLDLRQRLALFLQAADAVAHAHRHLIVHRDLKPPHILVASGASPDLEKHDKDGQEEREGATSGARGDSLSPSADAGARVKLLDFGIAKLLTEESGDLTQTGASGPLTPAYASPEQVLAQPITTATDVYALGLVLYELLTGTRAYVLDGLSAAQAERIICDTPPLAPSAKAPPEARRALRGDIDTIVAKALAKEPARRYATAADLAADLRRYLGGMPVEARPATARYRTSRFLRRHRVLAAVSAVAALLLIGVVAAFTVRLSAERDRAREEAATAQAVTDFLLGTFAEASPAVGQAIRPSELSLTDALRLGLQSADTAFVDRPRVRAALLQTLGQTFLDLGLYEDAAAPLQESLRLRDALGARGPEQIEALDALALLSMWRPASGDADALYRRSLDLRRSVYGPRSEEVALGMANLAENEIEHDRHESALALLRDALAIIAARPETTISGGEVLFIYAVGSFRAGHLADADSAYATLRGFADHLVASGAVDDDDDRIATILIGYAQTRFLLGHAPEAAPLFRDALRRRSARYDSGHPSLAEAQMMMGISLLHAARYAEAERLLRAALPGLSSGGPYNEDLHIARIALARSVVAQGRAAASSSLQADLETVRAELGPEHAWSRYAERQVAEIARASGARR